VVRICIADSSSEAAERICNLLEHELEARRIPNSIDIALSWREIDNAVSIAHEYQVFIICIDSRAPAFDWRKLSREVRQTESLCKIVFVSDRLEDAEEVFDFYPYCFIHRPNLEYRLPLLINKMFSVAGSSTRRLFTTKLMSYAVGYDDIVFCEHVQRKTQVVCERFTINVSEKLVNILADLPEEFVQTHSSFIVNMHHVRGLGKNNCVLDNGMAVPVSRARYSKMLEFFEKYVNRGGNSHKAVVNQSY
jgi:DNA-binding LytR/AlgR family response regulator